MDRFCEVWEIETGRRLHRFATGPDRVFDRIIALAFSPDGRFLTAGSVGFAIHLFDLSFGRRAVYSIHEDSVAATAYSPDGKTLAICTDYSGIVHLRDGRTAAPIAKLKGHSNNLRCCAWSRDGLLATGAADGCVKLWRDAKLVRTLMVD
jgi:WD40 repeat protein